MYVAFRFHGIGTNLLILLSSYSNICGSQNFICIIRRNLQSNKMGYPPETFTFLTTRFCTILRSNRIIIISASFRQPIK